MDEEFLVRFIGGPIPGTWAPVEWEWPFPDILEYSGGHYKKTSESQLPPQETDSPLVRAAQYQWIPQIDA